MPQGYGQQCQGEVRKHGGESKGDSWEWYGSQWQYDKVE